MILYEGLCSLEFWTDNANEAQDVIFAQPNIQWVINKGYKVRIDKMWHPNVDAFNLRALAVLEPIDQTEYLLRFT
jgi:hypothetical protein